MKTDNRWQQSLAHILIILVTVAAFMAAIQIRTDLAAGWVDSSIYYSLFLNKAEQIQRFGAIYFAGRWPWILFGATVFEVFPSAVASAVFTYCILSLVALSTYAFARCFMAPTAAALAGILAACNLQVAQTTAAGYPSVAAAALFFLAGVLSVRSWRRDAVALPFVAGLLYGLAVMTHPFVAVAGAPIYLVMFLMHWRMQRTGRLVMGQMAMVAGGLLVLPVSLVVFRVYYSLSSEVLSTMWATTKYSVLSGQGSWFSKSFDAFLLDGGAYLYFSAAILVTVVGLARSGWRWSRIERDHRLVYWLYLAPLVWLLLWDWAFRAVVMQYAFYQVFIYGVAALQLGLLAAQTGLFDRRPLSTLVALIVVYLAVLAAILAGLDLGLSMSVLLSAVAAVLAVACLGQMVTKRMPVRTGLSATLVLVAGLAAGLTRYGLSVHAPDVPGAPGIEAAKWAMQIARRYTGPTQPMLYAYNRGDYVLGPEYPVRNDRWDFIFDGRRSFFNIFDTIAGVYLWDRSMLLTDMSQKLDPTVPNKMLGLFKKTAVVIMWTKVDRRHETLEKLSAAGFRATEAATGVFRSGPFDFSWAVFDLEKSD
ncbi:MAG: hypothetical protein IJF82_03265 [Achromobacter sp.]|nr:hypothetical protein [Achromobacter sp.]